MDAVEGLRLRGGQRASWLRLSDERSGAILATYVFACPRWSGVPAEQTRDCLRRAFGLYGRPLAVRVDNGIPWGRVGGLPSGVSLWLAGLGVAMRWNPPRQPRRNGVVERTQGVSKRWAMPEGCQDVDELRRRLEREDHVQRAEYPAVEGQTRRQAYPLLWHSGRGYSLGWERLGWELSEALELLGRYRVRRKVSKRGQVSAYHRLIQVGQGYGEGWVYLGLDPRTAEWVVSGLDDQEIRRWPARGLTQEAIVGLKVGKD